VRFVGAAGGEVGVGGHAGGVVDGGGWHAGLLHGRHDLGLSALCRPPPDHGIEFLPGPGAGRGAGVAGVPAQLWPADGLRQAGEDSVGVGTDDHVAAVGARVGVGGHHAGDRWPGALADGPEGVVFGHHGVEQAVDGLVEGNVHRLGRLAGVAVRSPWPRRALPRLRAIPWLSRAPLPPEERQHRPQGRVDASHAVAQAHPHPGGRAVRVTGQEPEAAHGLGDAAEPGPVPVRAVLAEPGQPHQDHLGVRRSQLGGPQAKAFQGPGPEALDHHVTPGGQGQHQVAARRGVQIHGHRSLPPAE